MPSTTKADELTKLNGGSELCGDEREIRGLHGAIPSDRGSDLEDRTILATIMNKGGQRVEEGKKENTKTLLK